MNLPTPEAEGICRIKGRTFAVESYAVSGWPVRLPLPGKGQQVHFTLKPKGLAMEIALRLKSKRACDTLINLLTRYRLATWPEGDQE